MTDEIETETMDPAAVPAVPLITNPRNETGPLVAVTFQKNPHQKLKYLESEPKALGVTQIMLSVFQISAVALLDMNHTGIIISIVCSAIVIIAGCVAIAAQNLHLAVLKACLGMQVLACAASVLSFVHNAVMLADRYIIYKCWDVMFSNHENHSSNDETTCHIFTNAQEHFVAQTVLVQAALIAISATLAAYCCKVIQCCFPTSSMTVITVNTPAALQ